MTAGAIKLRDGGGEDIKEALIVRWGMYNWRLVM
jgi:hypothetical protein